MANESTTNQRSGGANIWLALVAGLAVGFAVGREMGARSSSGEGSKTAAEERPGAAPAGGGYASESKFPANWVKSAELTTARGIAFTGLNDAGKALAMQALNERKCECGCGIESVALCAKKDAVCPTSPKLAAAVVDMVRQGKTLTDLHAYLDRENKPGGGGNAGAAAAPAGPRKITIPAHSPRLGPKAAKVTIVEFSDFQCPFCNRVIPAVKEIEQKYPKDVAVVFVNQPLDMHPNAFGAAQAFLAAHRQGKAWPLHDKMFANQQALAPADLERHAKDVGLDVARFKKDFADPAIKAQVQADQTLANSVGANGTPTFFINGRELSGAQPFSAFQSVIDEEIKKADELIAKGTKLEAVYGKLMEQAAAAPPPPPPSAAPPAGAKVDVSPGDAPIKGPKNAPITIVAYSDFECPFCSRVNPTIKQVEDTYKGKVRIAFKNLPLPMHPHAETAAEAALAAHEQGKFWEMHDKLFANQQQLDRPALDRYAEELGLNMARFKAALDSGKHKKTVQSDAAEGNKIGANGTPTFFINGRILVGAVPFGDFQAIIDDELKKAK